MPRTYSVKAGQVQPFTQHRKGQDQPFTQHRAPKASDSTPDLKPLPRRGGRPPLIALEDEGSNTSYNNSSLGSPALSAWAVKNRKDDTFDQLFNKKEDSFDKLLDKKEDCFDKLFNKTEDSFDKMRTGAVQQQQQRPPAGPFYSGLSTPDSTAHTDRSAEVSRAGPGLFDSFSESKVPPMLGAKTKKPHKKSTNSNRLKSTRLKSHKLEAEQKSQRVLSETLLVQNCVKFVQDLTPCRLPDPSLEVPARSASQATSTPLLGSRSSVRDMVPSIGGSRAVISPMAVRQVLEDDVFRRSPEPDRAAWSPGDMSATPGPLVQATAAQHNSSLQEDDVFEATPVKSFVNSSRGSKKFSGPAASLMNHYGHQGTLALSLLAGGGKESVTEEVGAGGESRLAESLGVTVRVACVCGSDQVTESKLIMCDSCGLHLHTDCVGLDESSIAELEREELNWLCPGCRQGGGDHELFASPSAGLIGGDHDQEYLDSPSAPSALSGRGQELEYFTSPSGAAGVSGLGQELEHLPSPSGTAESSAVISGGRLESQERPADSFQPLSTVLSSGSRYSSAHSPASLSSSLQQTGEGSQDQEDLEAPGAAAGGAGGDDHGGYHPPAAGGEEEGREESLVQTPPRAAASGAGGRSSSVDVFSTTVDLLALRLAEDSASPLPLNLFAKPQPFLRPAPLRKPPMLSLCPSPGLAVKPGKSWRRSLALAARQERSIATPHLARLTLHCKSRSSFYVVPSLQTFATSLQAAAPSLLPSLPSLQPEVELSPKPVEEPEVVEEPNIVVVEEPNIVVEEPNIVVEEEPEEDVVEDDVSLGVMKLLKACTTPRITEFERVYSKDVMVGSKKLGEGAFGEVFRVGDEENASVLKIIPFGGDVVINEEKQTTVADISSEVGVSVALSQLREGRRNKTSGFVEVRGATVFQGPYPAQLLELWDLYKEQGGTENDRPDRLGEHQMFIALEFNNAGRDLEKYVFKNASQAFAAWKQVAHSLAAAEQEMAFEHRDLHWGNVLVKETKSVTPVMYTLGGDVFEVEPEGVHTTIIDFSLSRAEVRGDVIFNNLAEDPSIFEGNGREHGGDYQFDIYRKMKVANKNSWAEFRPETNVFWLHYMLEKMTVQGEVHYSGKKTSKPHKSGLARMNRLKSKLLEFSSATEWVRREGQRRDDV